MDFSEKLPASSTVCTAEENNEAILNALACAKPHVNKFNNIIFNKMTGSGMLQKNCLKDMAEVKWDLARKRWRFRLMADFTGGTSCPPQVSQLLGGINN